MAPRSADVEQFVGAVTASWRDAGGEPDIGMAVPEWIAECGLDIRSIRPIVDIVSTSHPSWTWLRTFLQRGRGRLADLGYLTPERAEASWETFTRLEATPGTLMVTPGVIELIAVRPS